MARDAFEAGDRRGDDVPIFIHSQLDDYGLSAIEFRVYARVARRAGNGSNPNGHYESAVSMAEEFEVSEKTIRRCLKVLTLAGLLHEQARSGQSSKFFLEPYAKWKPKSELKVTRERVLHPKRTPDTTDQGTEQPRTPGTKVPRTPGTKVPRTLQTDKGTPEEGTPKKNTPTETPSVVSPDSPLSQKQELWSLVPQVFGVDKKEQQAARNIVGREIGKLGEARVLQALREIKRMQIPPLEAKSYFLGVVKGQKATEDVCERFIGRAEARRKEREDERARGKVRRVGERAGEAGNVQGNHHSVVPDSHASAA